MRHLFLVGRLAEYAPSIANESAKHDDILQFDIVESYLNNTYKVIALYQWISRWCPSSKFLLKIDGDVYINLERFKAQIENFTTSSSFSYSALGTLERRPRAKRNASAKQFVPCDIFPFYKFSFEYLYGYASLISIPLLIDVHTLAVCLRGIFLDDVYLMGYIPHILGASLKNWVGLNSRIIVRRPKILTWSTISQYSITPELSVEEIYLVHQEKKAPTNITT